MFSGPSRTPFFLFVLSLCGALTGARAQIHEEKPAPGLEEGVLIHRDKQADGGKPLGAGKAIGTGDFSVVCHLALPVELPALNAAVAILTGSDEVASHDPKAEWKLLLNPDRSLSFTARPKDASASVNITTLPNAVRPAHAHDIVVSVHRDARQPLSGIWVDGIELASGMFTPMDLRASLPGGDWDMSGWVEAVTVYDRALTRPEVVEYTLRRIRPASPAPASAPPTVSTKGPLFVPQENETIALIGGTEAVALAESGELEAGLLMAFPQSRIHFRTLAWEGDTVFRQDRPMNFGSLEQQLLRVNAGAVWVMFGRQECLDKGREGLADFKTAFSELITTVKKQTPRIVIIGPPPFEKKAPPLPDLSGRNEDLRVYNEALKQIAAAQGATFAEIGLLEDIAQRGGITTDGVQLNATGLKMVAEVITRRQGNVTRKGSTAISPDDVDRLIAQGTGASAALAGELAAKNRLWHDYWRPSNWAFLYGDRTNQPSSRDPVNSQVRFFPAEQEKYLPLIREAEEKVYRTVEEAGKKLP